APDGTLLIGTGTALEHTASDPEHAQLFASGPDGDLQEAPALPGTDAGHVAVAPDGERVAVTSWTDSPVLLWDRAQDGREEPPRAPGAVGALTRAPDGTVLYGASSSEGVITWDGTDWTPFARPCRGSRQIRPIISWRRRHSGFPRHHGGLPPGPDARSPQRAARGGDRLPRIRSDGLARPGARRPDASLRDARGGRSCRRGRDLGADAGAVPQPPGACP